MPDRTAENGKNDKEDILAHWHSEKTGTYSFEEPYNSLSIWFDLYNHYPWVKLPAHLELITYDETGSVLTSEAWEPVPFE